MTANECKSIEIKQINGTEPNRSKIFGNKNKNAHLKFLTNEGWPHPSRSTARANRATPGGRTSSRAGQIL
jgi:hypothetical protein